MGWNSWDCFGTTVTEDLAEAQAAYMARHLKPHGWEYIVGDIQWYEPGSSGHAPATFRSATCGLTRKLVNLMGNSRRSSPGMVQDFFG